MGMLFMRENKPKVSVIVTVYNYEKYLPGTLKSLLLQTMEDFEIVLVDDGSTDGSLEIAEKFAKIDKRIKIFRQKNKGYAGAINSCLRKATGKYIAIHCADDFARPRKLEVLSRFLDENEDVDVVYSNYFMLKNGERLKFTPPEFDLGLLYVWNFVSPEGSMFRRALVEEFRGFDEKLPFGQDWDFWLRAGFAGKKFAKIPDRTYVRIIHGRNLSEKNPHKAEAVEAVRGKQKVGEIFTIVAFGKDWLYRLWAKILRKLGDDELRC